MQLVYLILALLDHQRIDCGVVSRGEILHQVNPVGSKGWEFVKEIKRDTSQARPVANYGTGLSLVEIGEATHLSRPPPLPSRWLQPSYTRPDAWQGNA